MLLLRNLGNRLTDRLAWFVHITDGKIDSRFDQVFYFFILIICWRCNGNMSDQVTSSLKQFVWVFKQGSFMETKIEMICVNGYHTKAIT